MHKVVARNPSEIMTVLNAVANPNKNMMNSRKQSTAEKDKPKPRKVVRKNPGVVDATEVKAAVTRSIMPALYTLAGAVVTKVAAKMVADKVEEGGADAMVGNAIRVGLPAATGGAIMLFGGRGNDKISNAGIGAGITAITNGLVILLGEDKARSLGLGYAAPTWTPTYTPNYTATEHLPNFTQPQLLLQEPPQRAYSGLGENWAAEYIPAPLLNEMYE